MTAASVYSTCFTGTTLSIVVALSQICIKLVLETTWDMVNVLAIGVYSARACEEPVVIASAPSNARTRYRRLGIRHCR